MASFSNGHKYMLDQSIICCWKIVAVMQFIMFKTKILSHSKG